MSTTTNDIDVVRLRELEEQIEAADADIRQRLEDRKTLYAEARADGFNHKVVKVVIRRRRMQQGELFAFDDTLTQYERALAQNE